MYMIPLFYLLNDIAIYFVYMLALIVRFYIVKYFAYLYTLRT